MTTSHTTSSTCLKLSEIYEIAANDILATDREYTSPTEETMDVQHFSCIAIGIVADHDPRGYEANKFLELLDIPYGGGFNRDGLSGEQEQIARYMCLMFASWLMEEDENNIPLESE